MSIDCSVAFYNRDEGGGCEKTKAPMLPSHQRFSARDLTSQQTHSGLVVGAEFIEFDCSAEFAFKLDFSCVFPDVASGISYPHLVAARTFRFIHHAVRAAKRVCCCFVTPRWPGDSGAARHEKFGVSHAH